MSASISGPTRPRSVESIFLNMVPLSRPVVVRTRRAASPASRERDSVSIARTRALGAGAGHTVTGTAPLPANSAPVSQAPVRSSATMVRGRNARGVVIGGTHISKARTTAACALGGILGVISMPRKTALLLALVLVVAAAGVGLLASAKAPAPESSPAPPAGGGAATALAPSTGAVDAALRELDLVKPSR